MTPLILDEIAGALGAKCVGSLSPVRVTGVSTDSRTIAAGELFFALAGPRYDGHAFVDDALRVGAGAVVERNRWKGTEVPEGKAVFLVSDSTEALANLARFYRRQLSGTVIAVTGSNGKTTTRSMIHHVLSGTRKGSAAEKSFNNHIGVPLTLLGADTTDEYIVVEIGSSASGEIDRLARLASPAIGVITGVAEAHLEGLRDLHGVAFEKASLLKHVRRGGLAVVNVDQPELRSLVLEDGTLALPDALNVVTYGNWPHAHLRLTDHQQNGRWQHFTINNRIPLRLRAIGRHNALNALAAYAVGRRLGLTDEQIASRLASFLSPPMRVERTRAGAIEIINDAYNANPGSMASALETLRTLPADGRRVLVVGDMKELGPQSKAWHEWLGREAMKLPIAALIAVGDHAEQTVNAARLALRTSGRSRRNRPRLVAFATARKAATAVGELLRPGDLVLVKGSRAIELERVVRAATRWARLEARNHHVQPLRPAGKEERLRPRPERSGSAGARAAS